MLAQSTFQLAGGPQAAPRARAALERFRELLEPGQLQDLRLLVSELVTNSVRHAETGPEESLSMHVEIREDAVRVEVLDNGPGFKRRVRRPNRRTGSGCGLYLVQQLADRWDVGHYPQTRVWFELDRASPEGSPTAVARGITTRERAVAPGLRPAVARRT